jgi:hypothetical protein
VADDATDLVEKALHGRGTEKELSAINTWQTPIQAS